MSQRERLLRRRIPPTPVSIRVEFTPEADAAFAEHEEASRALRNAGLRVAADMTAEQQRFDETKAALAPFVEVLLVSPIAAERYEELIGEHPPTDEQRKQGAQWNHASFVPALLAACVGQDEDDPMTEKDWAEWRLTAAAGASGELVTLFNTCLTVNDRSPDVRVGKG